MEPVWESVEYIREYLEMGFVETAQKRTGGKCLFASPDQAELVPSIPPAVLFTVAPLPVAGRYLPPPW